MAVTLKDIAQKVGVSVTIVSCSLSDYQAVAPERRHRIQTIAEGPGYYPNIIARRLQKCRTDTPDFITPTYGPRFSALFLPVETALHHPYTNPRRPSLQRRPH